MIDPLAEVIAHHTPRPPISLRPTYPEAEHKLEWELEIEAVAYRAQLSRGERMWAVVVEFAKGRGVIPQPLASQRTSDALIESGGHSSVIYDDGLFMDDVRNYTEIWMIDPVLLELAIGGRHDH